MRQILFISGISHQVLTQGIPPEYTSISIGRHKGRLELGPAVVICVSYG